MYKASTLFLQETNQNEDTQGDLHDKNLSFHIPAAPWRPVILERRKGIAWATDPMRVLLSNTIHHKDTDGQILSISFYNGLHLHFPPEKCPIYPHLSSGLRLALRLFQSKPPVVSEMSFAHYLIKCQLSLLSLSLHILQRPFQAYSSNHFGSSHYFFAFRHSLNL